MSDSFHTPSKIVPSLIEDEDGTFTEFINRSATNRMIDAHLEASGSINLPEYQTHKYKIRELIALCIFNGSSANLLSTVSPRVSEKFKKMNLTLPRKPSLSGVFEIVNLSNLRFKHVPLASLKFLNDHFRMKILNLSSTNVNVAQLNGANLNNVEALFLENIGLTTFPRLLSFSILRVLDLSNNNITKLEPEGYFDKKAKKYGELPHLEFLYLYNNPIKRTDISSEFARIFVYDADIILDESSLSISELRLNKRGGSRKRPIGLVSEDEDQPSGTNT
ncbi:uncharacterized protein VICG_00391 [Vittaforma corneae ATCC 50505]|uniref:U2A'/phosphoprotein 32 family A C-terminal domain-containing protein n=1 Tax=Vittaforma corneae (strain ATCC 50505) TaxID=993615 RepID=L2GPX1_VITCO|nr:uncharacterized protein VICG_00391 [Vittaforma corneae ATCC 50505]ELA42639.1 hypothetical protein VICG_00391 [Vittaforma corneae ATCC 50505]